MTTHKEKFSGSSFAITMIDGHESVVFDPRRNPFLVTCVGLSLLTLIVVAAYVAAREPRVTLNAVVAFLAWTSCGMGIALQLARMLWEREILTVIEGNLEVRRALGKWSRRTLYTGLAVRDLRALPSSLFETAATGIEFKYGHRVIHLAPGLSESEGKLVVKLLAKDLPPSAIPPESWNEFWQPPREPRLLEGG